MGFDVQGIKFLLAARRDGVSFARTAMIGRQELFIDPTTLNRLLQSAGLGKDFSDTAGLLTESGGFAEPLLRRLGAKEIVSLDASHYEEASLVHDLNQPIPESLRKAFSAVIDAGTLEHVFNFPVAMKNCMEMVEPGGHLLLMTPANNFMGHGFYQFSPELFFRVLSQENGFQVSRAIVCETDPEASWYEVVDPARAGRRVEMRTSRPAYLLVQARRTREVPIFAVTPQQSDYTVLWGDQRSKPEGSPASGPMMPLRLWRGLSRRLGLVSRRLIPSGLRLKHRPDSQVFIPTDWDRDPSSKSGRA
jgi:hypothetical protein